MRPVRLVLVCAKIELASDMSYLNLDLALYLTDTGVFPSFDFFLNCERTISNAKGSGKKFPPHKKYVDFEIAPPANQTCTGIT